MEVTVQIEPARIRLRLVSSRIKNGFCNRQFRKSSVSEY